MGTDTLATFSRGVTMIALQQDMQHSGKKYRKTKHLILTTHMQKADNSHSLIIPVHYQANTVTYKNK